MKFAHPEFLYALPVFLLVLIGVWRFGHRRVSEARTTFAGVGSSGSWARSGGSPTRRLMDLCLALMSVAFLVLALARPLWFRRASEEELQGVPFIVALDASRSMLASDVKPNRYGAASNALDHFFAENRADRIGLITFSGVAYLNSPLAYDMTSLRTILRYIQPEDYIDPGSSLTQAIERAGRYFVSNNIPQRVLVLISDGEDLEGRPVEVARRYNRDFGLKICTIGVGTAAGANVPAARNMPGVVTNTFGQRVVTRLNEGMLQRIASATGGRFYRLGETGEGLQLMRKEFLAPLAETAARENLQNYRELFQIPLALALICMIFKLFLSANRFVNRPSLPSIYTQPNT